MNRVASRYTIRQQTHPNQARFNAVLGFIVCYGFGLGGDTALSIAFTYTGAQFLLPTTVIGLEIAYLVISLGIALFIILEIRIGLFRNTSHVKTMIVRSQDRKLHGNFAEEELDEDTASKVNRTDDYLRAFAWVWAIGTNLFGFLRFWQVNLIHFDWVKTLLTCMVAIGLSILLPVAAHRSEYGAWGFWNVVKNLQQRVTNMYP